MKEQKDIVRAYRRYLKLQRGFSPEVDALKQSVDVSKWEGHRNRAIIEVLFSCGLRDVGIGPRSQCRILSGVRSFYRFLQLDGYRDDDPTELLESPVLGEHLPEVLTTQRSTP